MRHWTLSNVVEGARRGARRYQEFVRAGTMSAGVYRLARGAEDPQQPHREDELYYVIAGRGELSDGRERVAVEPGSFVFVEAGRPHRFENIIEDLTVLVLFAPEETETGPPPSGR